MQISCKPAAGRLWLAAAGRDVQQESGRRFGKGTTRPLFPCTVDELRHEGRAQHGECRKGETKGTWALVAHRRQRRLTRWCCSSTAPRRSLDEDVRRRVARCLLRCGRSSVSWVAGAPSGAWRRGAPRGLGSAGASAQPAVVVGVRPGLGMPRRWRRGTGRGARATQLRATSWWRSTASRRDRARWCRCAGRGRGRGAW